MRTGGRSTGAAADTDGSSRADSDADAFARPARRRLLLRAAVIVLAALLVTPVALSWHAEAQAARELRERYRFGSRIGYGLILEDVRAYLEGLARTDADLDSAAPQGGTLVSAHDLFMLVEAAKFQVGRDELLARSAAQGRLPVLYAFLDGYDTDAIVLRRSLRDALPEMPVPDAGARPGAFGIGAKTALASWQLAPVLLCLRSSPSVRDAAAHVVADEPLLSVHTQGQVLSGDVKTWGVRYALACVDENPSARAKEIAELEGRVRELASVAAARSGADDASYVRAAFDLIARGVGYAEQGASAHDNDAYGALVEGKARCYGLASALKLVLDARGIPNYLANGTKATGRHTVNVLWMEGSWRVCDLTLMVDVDDAVAGHAGTGEHQGIYACLALERNYCIEHGFAPDDDARLLELVYARAASELEEAAR